MNVLFFGSDELWARVLRQSVGQTWELQRAEDPDQVLDFEGTHSFQAALVGLCEEANIVRATSQNVKARLDVPVVIGLASRGQAADMNSRPHQGIDLVIPECGNDALTKRQCDAILRLANGARGETISCGGVTFETSRNSFYVHGRHIHLPYKQYKLLELLFLKQGRTVTKEVMFNHLYGWDDPPSFKIVDVFICHIRKALREAGLTQDCIQTVWGHGYKVFDARLQCALAVA